jgi:hypothetical protein
MIEIISINDETKHNCRKLRSHFSKCNCIYFYVFYQVLALWWPFRFETSNCVNYQVPTLPKINGFTHKPTLNVSNRHYEGKEKTNNKIVPEGTGWTWGITPLILILSWLLHALAALYREIKTSSAKWRGGRVGPKAGLGVSKKIKFLDPSGNTNATPRFPARSLVTYTDWATQSLS